MIVEEIQKTKRMLIAECPRRVQFLCEKLFEVNQPGHIPAYYDNITESDTLQKMSHVESLPDHAQPSVLSRWRLPHTSAPTKSIDKPESRRPLIDRSQCPTCLNCRGSRAVDWISSLFLRKHLRINLDRTDQFVLLLREFGENVPGCQIHIGGADVDTCFMNMPHNRVWAA